MDLVIHSQETLCTEMSFRRFHGCRTASMAYHALSELKPGVKNWNVCVHVSRLWEYRGGTDTGPVQHVDMLLVDNKGNAMYAEIGKDDLEEKAPLLAEGNTYTLTRFMVSLAKRSYRAVQGMYMINFTCHTIVEAVADIQDGFPEFVYDPVPFSDLPAYVGENKRFVDIVGVIVSVCCYVSPHCAPANSDHQAHYSPER